MVGQLHLYWAEAHKVVFTQAVSTALEVSPFICDAVGDEIVHKTAATIYENDIHGWVCGVWFGDGFMHHS